MSFDTGKRKQGENAKNQTLTVPKGIDGEKSELALALEEGGTGSDP